MIIRMEWLLRFKKPAPLITAINEGRVLTAYQTHNHEYAHRNGTPFSSCTDAVDWLRNTGCVYYIQQIHSNLYAFVFEDPFYMKLFMINFGVNEIAVMEEIST